MSRTLINKYFDDVVTANGTDVQNWDDIPEGQTWHLDRMGVCSAGESLVALQKRIGVSPAVWQTLRMFRGPANQEFEVNQDFVGDASGIMKLRIVRRELSGSDQEIVVWAEGYKSVE